LQPAEDGKKAFSLRTLIGAIILLATFCVAVVLYSHRLVQRDFEANTAFIRIATDVAHEVSIAHLRLEEAIAGKDTIDLGRDILQPIRDARARTDTGMLTDRLAGADIVSTVQQDLVELRGRVDEFIDLAEARWIRRDSPLGKVGGELDRTLDEVFDDIMRRTRLLVGNVNAHIMEDRKQIVLINMGTVFTLVILFLGVAALIARNRKVLDTRAAALRRLVHERTARLKSREAEAVYRSVQLAAAEQRANAASAAKSHFLASMSHEIRTPMTGVLGTTSLLARTDLTPEQREYVDTLSTSGLSLLKIINEVLDFSKIEAGEVTLDHVDFLLEPSINDVLHLFSAAAAQRNLKLELDIADDVPAAINGDPGRIGQVLSNLVSNAIKFSQDGTVEILCGLAEDQPDDPGRIQLFFAVTDHGPGISEADQARLFKEFCQLYRDPREARGGTGLGLAITRDMISQLDGEVGLENAESGGARATIRLQRWQEPETSS
jgi:signal transduction histidine kinase